MREPTSALSVRPAEPRDCRAHWEWRNEPGARAASLSRSEIPLEHHERWFAERLLRPEWPLFVVTAGGRDVGYMRFDQGVDEALVSVALAPEARGRGWGSAALRLGLREFRLRQPRRRIVALIRPDNDRSVAAFAGAGFVRAGERVVEGQPMLVMVAAGTPRKRALVAADAGPGVGFGHLSRGLALGAALERQGTPAAVLVNDAPWMRDRVDAVGLEAVLVPGGLRWDEAGAGRLETLARDAGADTVVVDSYEVDAAALSALRAAGLLVVAIDDLAERPFPCQVVVNGGAGAESLPYRSASGDTRFLLGPGYALLGPSFWTREARRPRPDGRAVLISTGATDPGGVTRRLVAAADAVPTDFTIDVVMGPFAGDASGRALPARRHPVRVHRDCTPQALRDLALGAAAAVSGAGQTLSELAWAGCATVGVALADNQRPGLEAMTARGAVLSAGALAAPDLEAKVTAGLERLLGDAALEAAVRRAGQELVDGLGALRVAAELAR